MTKPPKKTGEKSGAEDFPTKITPGEEPATAPTSARGLKLGLILISIIGAVILVCYTAQVLLVFFAAIFLSVFFSGLAHLIQKYFGLGYPASLALALIGLASLVVLGGLIMGPAIADQASNLTDTLPKAYHQVVGQLKNSPVGRPIINTIQNAFHDSKDSTWDSGMKFFGLTVHGLGGIIFAIVIGIFLASDPSLYRNGLLALFPKTRRKRMAAVLDELGYTLWWWLMGQFLIMASVGILIGIGLTLLGVPLSGTLGLLAAILAFIPSLGPLISVIPAIILGLTVSPMMGLWVCLLYLGVQTLEANVISPLVQQKAIDLPAALILGAELLIGLLLGAPGLAFATPLAAVGLVLVNMLYIQDYLGEKGSLPSRG